MRPQPTSPAALPARPRRKRRRILYILYLLAIVAGAYLIYGLVPADLKEAIRDTYLNPDAVVDPSAGRSENQP